MYRVLLLLAWWCGSARGARDDCPQGLSLELGTWTRTLAHLDSTVVQRGPADAKGLIFVYENVFPGFRISYVHVSNAAVRTCGAQPTLKSGGLGQPSVLLLLYAEPGQEIRAVIDVWGQPDFSTKLLLNTRQKYKSTFFYTDSKAPLLRH